MRHKWIVLGVLVPWLVAASAAQSDGVDGYVRAEMKGQNIPGLSLAVVREGKILKAEGYGVSDLGRRTPASAETIYKIGSVSKQFIATGIMLLLQDGRIALDDRISAFLTGAPQTWSAITVRHLLTHTSGILREPPGFDPFKTQSDADVIKSAYGAPLRFPPGEKWEYSNTGYFILAEIISKVSGTAWHEYLRARVFEPLGMTQTHATHVAPSLSNRAKGYSDNDRLRDATNWTAGRPSGAFLSNVLDLATWDAALHGDRILTAAVRRQMWTPVALNDGRSHPYGFGWELNPLDGHTRVHHGGGIAGFQAELARYVDDGLTVIVLINLDDADVERIADGVAALYWRSGY